MVRERYSGWHALGTRILIVNLLALAALAGAFFYLDSYRTRLIDAREQELIRQGEMVAGVLETVSPGDAARSVNAISTTRGTRIRLIGRDGGLLADNWAMPGTHRFVLVDPTTEGFRRDSARLIDRVVDAIIGKKELPPVPDDPAGRLPDYPEIAGAITTGIPQSIARQTPDRLIVLQAAIPVMTGEAPYEALLLTADATDVLELVRRERQGSFFVFLGVLAASLGLSLYLARTIVAPLRQLAFAAHRVRLGRARDVVVPRLPHRRDEIGGLARALADMTAALRQRIDATETFAADVAHELKNPLASIGSAIETLDRVQDADGRQRLFAMIKEDVGRIDRLILDISAASRLEAELSRSRRERVDLNELASRLVEATNSVQPLAHGVRLVADVSGAQPLQVRANMDRLSQVINNLVDNAVSFSPPGGTVRIGTGRTPRLAEIFVEDDGPGVPPEARGNVFTRFYSERPGVEDYGRHSGLGLSIAAAIIEDLGGHVRVEDRPDGREGARFVVAIPYW